MNYTAELADTMNQYLSSIGIQTDPLVGQIIISLFILIASLIIGWIVYFIFKHNFSRWAKKTKTTLDDEILINIRLPIYLVVLVVGFYYALTPLSFIRPYENEVAILFSIIEILLVTFAVNRVINVIVAWYGQREAKRKKEMSDHLLFLMRKILHAVVYLFAILFVLYAFEINLSGAIVGLGVGGIAIAFALQNVLSDMFSAFTIYFDRPFEIGDFITLGSDAGTVKKIGIISTRIQTLQGEELVVSNQELISTRIRNFKKMQSRRINFQIGVIYGTPLKKLKKIPDIIKEIIDSMGVSYVDRVHFKEFGNFSLNFEIVYYIKSKDYVVYMDTQQEINFKIKDAFEKEGIEMAFPTQTLFIEKQAE